MGFGAIKIEKKLAPQQTRSLSSVSACLLLWHASGSYRHHIHPGFVTCANTYPYFVVPFQRARYLCPSRYSGLFLDRFKKQFGQYLSPAPSGLYLYVLLSRPVLVLLMYRCSFLVPDVPVCNTCAADHLITVCSFRLSCKTAFARPFWCANRSVSTRAAVLCPMACC